MRYFYKLAYLLLRLYWRLVKPITIGVRLLMIQDGAVVLVKHTYDAGWHMPGGGLKRGETLEAAVRREAAEETGAILEHLSLLGIYSSFYQAKSDHVAVFVSEKFTLTKRQDRAEIEQVGVFPLDNLPPQASEGTKRRIAEYRQQGGPYFGAW